MGSEATRLDMGVRGDRVNTGTHEGNNPSRQTPRVSEGQGSGELLADLFIVEVSSDYISLLANQLQHVPYRIQSLHAMV